VYCRWLHGFRSPSATPTPAPLVSKKGKGRPYSITEHRVPELIPVLGSQPAGGVSHKPGGRLPLLSARPAVTLATLKRAATSFAAWWTKARWVWTVCLKLVSTASHYLSDHTRRPDAARPNVSNMPRIDRMALALAGVTPISRTAFSYAYTAGVYSPEHVANKPHASASCSG